MVKTNRSAGLIATVCGIGYAPAAPGTFGSAAGLALTVAAGLWLGVPAWLTAAAIAVPAVWASDKFARHTAHKDPQTVVIDEVVGQAIAMAGAAVWNWKTYIAAFVLFRLFDIVKPFPAGRLENLPGGWGIVADDAMAGVYAAIVLYAAALLHLY
jgi:phosphatidylglycerophosphatase A